ncbi:MAG: hypothetical protein M3Z46_06770 [Actinomycetota bacterium]|nr:hypothetical protein [Actinomycetota bacterium]
MRLPRLAIAVAGFGSAVVIARASGADAADTVGLIGLAGGTAALAALLVGFVGRALARRPLRTQLAAVAIGSLVGVGIGALVGARAMFLSQHDTGAITVLLVAAGTVGVLAALTLTDRLDRSLADLGSLVQQIEERSPSSELIGARVSGPPELARLAEELRDVRSRLDEANRRQRALERSRGELITWVSHDFAAPLARIRVLASSLDDTATGTRHELRCEVDRLATIVDDLLELSEREVAVAVDTDNAPGAVAAGADNLFDLAFRRDHELDRSAGVAVGPTDQR